jgi:2-keto-4-pentenoate hydratase/2-oxohepta-3-ene-1,7-dioic acid hydratase in catechol pathway
MRIARVARPGGPDFVAVADDHVRLMSGVPFAEHVLTDQVAPLEDVKLLAPVIPSKVYCVGRNYADHAAEMGGEVPAEPLIFSKPATSVIGTDDAIRLPRLSEDVHHEAELAVVIGVLARHVPREKAMEYVFGYTCANDVTARDLQRRDGQWTRAKGFDTFCPLGPWIETDFDPSAVGVRALVDGVIRQEGNTRDLVFDIPALVAYCSAFSTLLPGDVILTGTPSGVGPILAGQSVQIDIDGIGALTNPVVDET